jgi:hypothetical protein
MAYLKTRSSRQAPPQFHHGATDFVADARSSVLMVYWSDGGASVMTVMAVMRGCHWALVAFASTSCRCRCGGCGCLLVTTEALHERWLAGSGVLITAGHCDLFGS